jgi:hypothetical protein
VKARYWFWYGVALGVLVAAGLSALLNNTAIGWMLALAAVALAVGLLIHQRSAVRERGRRWRKTVS